MSPQKIFSHTVASLWNLEKSSGNKSLLPVWTNPYYKRGQILATASSLLRTASTPELIHCNFPPIYSLAVCGECKPRLSCWRIKFAKNIFFGKSYKYFRHNTAPRWHTFGSMYIFVRKSVDQISSLVYLKYELHLIPGWWFLAHTSYLSFILHRQDFAIPNFYTQKLLKIPKKITINTPKKSIIYSFSRSIWKILHLIDFFYTGTARGARDKYEVCSRCHDSPNANFSCGRTDKRTNGRRCSKRSSRT